MKTVGSRAQVWNGNAKKTSGGLTKKDLFKKKGRIRSKRASKSAKRNQNLKNAGWTFKKGEFGAVRIEDKKKGSKKKGSKKMKGGAIHQHDIEWHQTNLKVQDPGMNIRYVDNQEAQQDLLARRGASKAATGKEDTGKKDNGKK